MYFCTIYYSQKETPNHTHARMREHACTHAHGITGKSVKSIQLLHHVILGATKKVALA